MEEITPPYSSTGGSAQDTGYTPQAFNTSAAAVAPFTPSTDATSGPCFNPHGMPYFATFPAYPPVNFQYFPSASVTHWRPTDPAFSSSLAAPYPNSVSFPASSSLLDPIRKRKARKLYASAQLEILEREYRKHPYVTKEERVRIGKMTGITEDKVKIWYQNKRYKDKQEKGESTSSEGRRTQSPSEEERKPSPKMSNFFTSPQPSESAWLPDLNTPTAPPFNPSAYAPQPFTFFPPSSYHPFAMPNQPPWIPGVQDPIDPIQSSCSQSDLETRIE